MIFLDELRNFDDSMTAEDKVKATCEYLKEMKDAYEVCIKGLEKEISECKSENEKLSEQITSLKSRVAALETKVAEL